MLFATIRGSFRLRTLAGELRNIFWLTVAAIVLAALTLALPSWILLGGLCFILDLNLAQWLYFRYYLERACLEDVDEMTGWEFERWLALLFERLDFNVERTPYRDDFGADFVLT